MFHQNESWDHFFVSPPEMPEGIPSTAGGSYYDDAEHPGEQQYDQYDQYYQYEQDQMDQQEEQQEGEEAEAEAEPQTGYRYAPPVQRSASIGGAVVMGYGAYAGPSGPSPYSYTSAAPLRRMDSSYSMWDDDPITELRKEEMEERTYYEVKEADTRAGFTERFFEHLARLPHPRRLTRHYSLASLEHKGSMPPLPEGYQRSPPEPAKPNFARAEQQRVPLNRTALDMLPSANTLGVQQQAGRPYTPDSFLDALYSVKSSTPEGGYFGSQLDLNSRPGSVARAAGMGSLFGLRPTRSIPETPLQRPKQQTRFVSIPVDETPWEIDPTAQPAQAGEQLRRLDSAIARAAGTDDDEEYERRQWEEMQNELLEQHKKREQQRQKEWEASVEKTAQTMMVDMMAKYAAEWRLRFQKEYIALDIEEQRHRDTIEMRQQDAWGAAMAYWRSANALTVPRSKYSAALAEKAKARAEAAIRQREEEEAKQRLREARSKVELDREARRRAAERLEREMLGEPPDEVSIRAAKLLSNRDKPPYPVPKSLPPVFVPQGTSTAYAPWLQELSVAERASELERDKQLALERLRERNARAQLTNNDAHAIAERRIAAMQSRLEQKEMELHVREMELSRKEAEERRRQEESDALHSAAREAFFQKVRAGTVTEADKRAEAARREREAMERRLAAEQELRQLRRERAAAQVQKRALLQLELQRERELLEEKQLAAAEARKQLEELREHTRLREQIEAEREQALWHQDATRIQSVWRSHQARKRVNAIRAEREEAERTHRENFQKFNQSALKIQKVYRGHLGRALVEYWRPVLHVERRVLWLKLDREELAAQEARARSGLEFVEATVREELLRLAFEDWQQVHFHDERVAFEEVEAIVRMRTVYRDELTARAQMVADDKLSRDYIALEAVYSDLVLKLFRLQDVETYARNEIEQENADLRRELKETEWQHHVAVAQQLLFSSESNKLLFAFSQWLELEEHHWAEGFTAIARQYKRERAEVTEQTITNLQRRFSDCAKEEAERRADIESEQDHVRVVLHGVMTESEEWVWARLAFVDRREQEVLRHRQTAATEIQRTWRGHSGRKQAAFRRENREYIRFLEAQHKLLFELQKQEAEARSVIRNEERAGFYTVIPTPVATAQVAFDEGRDRAELVRQERAERYEREMTWQTELSYLQAADSRRREQAALARYSQRHPGADKVKTASDADRPVRFLGGRVLPAELKKKSERQREAEEEMLRTRQLELEGEKAALAYRLAELSRASTADSTWISLPFDRSSSGLGISKTLVPPTPGTASFIPTPTPSQPQSLRLNPLKESEQRRQAQSLEMHHRTTAKRRAQELSKARTKPSPFPLENEVDLAAQKRDRLLSELQTLQFELQQREAQEPGSAGTFLSHFTPPTGPRSRFPPVANNAFVTAAPSYDSPHQFAMAPQMAFGFVPGSAPYAAPGAAYFVPAGPLGPVWQDSLYQ
eukprot:TRINITY_DN13857_c0_g1_i1.p1 TRINITY_DN13857_c0_g1~~TRINITY_DN13857_c0_g1_i1.p1  ORF type:complete len:1469 (+),score=307.66 TRINITY_DN13857_c0_g1_i1:51-4457(+)